MLRQAKGEKRWSKITVEILLVLLILTGILGGSPIIATASSFLLMMKLIHLEHFFPTIERRGLELGLLFLTIAVLVPFAAGKISLEDIRNVFFSAHGLLAISAGSVAAFLNGKGLELLKSDPHLMIGLVVGSVLGIIFLRGIPTGPMMGAALTMVFLKIFQVFFPSS